MIIMSRHVNEESRRDGIIIECVGVVLRNPGRGEISWRILDYLKTCFL